MPSVIHIVESIHDVDRSIGGRNGQAGAVTQPVDRRGPEIRTERLVLRRWRETDRAPFAAMNADPVVMEFFPKLLTREESDDFVDRIEAAFEERGWGLWAVEVVDGGAFAGFVGLWPADFDADFTPAVEIGWRLDAPFWGRGYAPEAAKAALQFGFEELGLDEIVSFTAVINVKSQRVMQKIGMTSDPADGFDHPRPDVPERLRRHVLYRISP
jgi:RimJ/RimL family protein N-acetyltransferase